MKETTAALVSFLNEARQSLLDLDTLQQKVKNTEMEEKKYEKALNAERKAVLDQADLTVKKRKEEISASYDRELRDDQEKLKKAKAKREKAKSQGVQARIEDETSDLHEENRQLKTKIKTLFKQNHVPRFCNTMLYYALFFTRGLKSVLVLLLTIIICFLLIPCGIYFIWFNSIVWHLAVIYLVDIVVFVGLYILIANRTKVNHTEILREGRKIREMIAANKKKIKAIQNSIKKDKNEEMYNLTNYDNEIAEIEKELKDIASRKEDALYVFENETSLVIKNEIKQNYQERIDSLSSRKREYEEQYKTLSGQLKTMSINITDNYESRLGREFMTPDKIEALIRIFEEEKAETLLEAQELYRNKLN